MKSLLIWTAVLFYLASAGLWAFASIQTVAPANAPDAAGLMPFRIVETDGETATDVLATAKRQTRWNFWAALAAAIATAAQAFSLLL
jgi:hypothetical protein